MTGDTGEGHGGGQTSQGGDGSSGGAFAIGVGLGALIGGRGGGFGGLGGSALRGTLQLQQLIAQRQLLQTGFQTKLQLAESERAAHFAPGERTLLQTFPAYDAKAQKMVQQVAKLRQQQIDTRRSGVMQRRAAIAERTLLGKIAQRQADDVLRGGVQYVAAYGLNMGPPLPGARF